MRTTFTSGRTQYLDEKSVYPVDGQQISVRNQLPRWTRPSCPFWARTTRM